MSNKVNTSLDDIIQKQLNSTHPGKYDNLYGKLLHLGFYHKNIISEFKNEQMFISKGDLYKKTVNRFVKMAFYDTKNNVIFWERAKESSHEDFESPILKTGKKRFNNIVKTKKILIV